MRIFIWLIIAVFLALVGIARLAFATSTYPWPPRPVPITVQVSEVSIASTVQQVVADYNTVLGPYYGGPVMRYGGVVNTAFWVATGDNFLGLTYNPTPITIIVTPPGTAYIPPGCDNFVLGPLPTRSTLCNDHSTLLLWFWWVLGANDRAAIRHEIAHALGLKDDPTPGTLMGPDWPTTWPPACSELAAMLGSLIPASPSTPSCGGAAPTATATTAPSPMLAPASLCGVTGCPTTPAPTATPFIDICNTVICPTPTPTVTPICGPFSCG